MDRLNLNALRNLSLDSRSGGSSSSSRDSSRGSRRGPPSEADSDMTYIDDGPPALERLRTANIEQYGPEAAAELEGIERFHDGQGELGFRSNAFGGSRWGRSPGSVAGSVAESTASWVTDRPAGYIGPRGERRSAVGSQARSQYDSVAGSVTGSVSSRQTTSTGYGNVLAPSGRSHRGPGSVTYPMVPNGGQQINTFWPDIKPLLTNDAVLLDYTLTCPQCAISMSAAEAGTQHRAMILSCGHMMCEGCVTRIAANEKQCPYCAAPVGKYLDCAQGCKNPGMVGLGLPANMEELRKIPRTTLEGASQPVCCPKCRILRIERDSMKLVCHLLNDTRARAVWNPYNDHRPDTGDYSDYVRVPELDRFLAVLRDTVHSVEIHRQYTWLQPDHRNNYAQVWAEKRDYTRPRSGRS